MSGSRNTDIEICIAYAGKDKSFLEAFESHLGALAQQGILQSWYGWDVTSNPEDSLESEMSSANAVIICLLISDRFLASEFCSSIAFERLLELHEDAQVVVVPILLHSIDWAQLPLSKLQVLVEDTQLILTWSPREQNFPNADEGILLALDQLWQRRSLDASHTFYKDMQKLYEYVLQERLRKVGEYHRDTIACLNMVAKLFVRKGMYTAAEPFAQRALDSSQHVFGVNHWATAASMDKLAFIYTKMKAYGEAENLYERALTILENETGELSVDAAHSMNNLAVLYKRRGKYEEAEVLYRRAVKIDERVLGAEHVDTARDVNNWAGMLIEQGRYELAEPLCKRVLHTWEHSLGEDHIAIASILNRLAFVSASQGKYSEAEPLYRRALRICKAELGEKHPDTLRMQVNHHDIQEKVL